MKTRILKTKGDWEEVVDDCRHTMNKEPLGHEPSDKFKKSILIAEHSPIRDIIIKWAWDNMPHWVTVHFARHKFEKFIASQRTDRTGIDRHVLPQDTPQNFIAEANVQSLIDLARKRLCFHASPETREYMEDLKQEITDSVDKNIGDVLVPNCIYRGGCPEQKGCKLYESFVKKYGQISDIQERYDLYNKDFKERKE